MKKILFIFAVFLFFFSLQKNILADPQPESTIMEGKILTIVSENRANSQTNEQIQKVKVQIVSGKLNGKIISIDDHTLPTGYNIDYKRGDHVILTYSKDPGGNEIFYITDYDRKNGLLLLFFLFLVLTFIVGKWQGLSSLLGMFISFFVIIFYIVPHILHGSDPFTTSIIGAIIIIPVTYFLAHGFKKKTVLAIIGTFLTLLLTGFLAYIFSDIAKLTGYGSEEALYLQNAEGGSINVKSLLLAGIMIGSLAVLNDITISQASIVTSLYKSNPALTVKELYSHAMAVGKDHIASLVNTLILVYAGASLPLLILFYTGNAPATLIINQEVIATEVIRTLVSSIGIIAAVPITTYLSAIFIKKK